MVVSCDCLIVGGGPAGAALAFLLARRGLHVVLVDHGRAHYSGPYESLLAPVHKLLQRSGLSALVLPHAAVDPLRHGAIWGSDAVAWRDAAEPGLLLRRGAFDQALRQAAVAMGANLHCPARLEPSAGGAFTIVTVRGAETVLPRCVVVATGRASVALPCQREVLAVGARTTALVYVGEPAASDRGTAIVEAVPTGWIWTHAPHSGAASAAVLLDGEAIAEHGAPLALHAALVAARGPAARLQHARVQHATDATPRLWRAVGSALLLGDAAACIDPMASQGVEKALAAADHAAAVVATGVCRPEWWERLRTAHAQWEAGLFFGHGASTAQWYAGEHRFADAVFWQRRRVSATGAAASVDWDTPLVRSPALTLQTVLVREAEVFGEREGVRHAASGEELSHVGYVSVRPLLELFATPSSLRHAVANAGHDARLHVLSPHAVHTGLRALVARGWLIAASNATSNR